MDLNDVTIWAALIAFVASVVNIIVSVFSVRSVEKRRAHRELMTPYMCDLSESMHQMLAASDVHVKASQNGTLNTKWTRLASDSKKTIDESRRRLRYPLWGLDEGLRTLTRTMNWTCHLRSDETKVHTFLKKADDLKLALDYAIMRSYRKGSPPGMWSRFRVWSKARAVRKCFEETNPRTQ